MAFLFIDIIHGIKVNSFNINSPNSFKFPLKKPTYARYLLNDWE